MDISSLYAQTLTTLNNTRTNMLTPEFAAALQTQTDAQKLEARQNLAQVELAITTLENKQLTDITAQMTAEQSNLQSAISGLSNALSDITRVQTILSNITQVLTVVGKIVSLV